MPLINCEVNLVLAWSADCGIIYTDITNQIPTFTITETNLYPPVVTYQLKIMQIYYHNQNQVLKRAISWNKYLSKPELLRRNPNLNHLVEPSFQGVNSLFVLAFENNTQRTSNKRYYLPNVEVKDYNVMIDGKNFFDQPVKNNKVTYENIRKIAIGQGNDYATGLGDCNWTQT